MKQYLPADADCECHIAANGCLVIKKKKAKWISLWKAWRFYGEVFFRDIYSLGEIVDPTSILGEENARILRSAEARMHEEIGEREADVLPHNIYEWNVSHQARHPPAGQYPLAPGQNAPHAPRSAALMPEIQYRAGIPQYGLPPDNQAGISAQGYALPPFQSLYQASRPLAPIAGNIDPPLNPPVARMKRTAEESGVPMEEVREAARRKIDGPRVNRSRTKMCYSISLRIPIDLLIPGGQ